MSKVPDKHSISVARKVQASGLSEGGWSSSDSSSSGECKDEILGHKAQAERRELREKVKQLEKDRDGKISKASPMNLGRWKWMKSCKSNDGKWMSCQICCQVWWTSTKRSGSRTCKILSRDGMLFGWSIKKMQKRSQNLQSLPERKHCHKDMAKFVGDSQRIRNEVEEKHA